MMKKISYLSTFFVAIMSVILSYTPDIAINEVFAQQPEGLSSNSTSNTTNISSKKVPLLIEGLAVNQSPTNLVEVTGDIKNNQTTNVDDVKIIAEYYDKDGSLSGKSDNFASNPSFILKPGEKIVFNILEVVGFHRVSSYNITAYGDIVN